MKRTLVTLLSLSLALNFMACDTDEDEIIDDVLDGTLVINEFLASNDAGYADENGEFDDWIELYNGSADAIDIGGYYISDDTEEPLAWQIPSDDSDATTIPSGGYLILWADKEADQGTLHLGEVKLSSGGESIVLTDPDGITTIDSYDFLEQVADVSEGRETDGASTWTTFDTPTPGASNN